MMLVARTSFTGSWPANESGINKQLLRSVHRISDTLLECELLDRTRFRTTAEAEMAVFDFIEGFYNPRRRHSSLGYLSPIDYERAHPAAA